MKIVLAGPKCSGKTTIGKSLAKTLALPFHESDDELEKIFFEEHRLSLNCREICAKYGELLFRCYEKRAIKSVFDKDNCVIATGGSSLLDSETLELSFDNAILVFLDTNLETLVNRWKTMGNNSYLDSQKPQETFVSRVKMVKNKVRQKADITLDNSNMSIEETITAILEKL